MFKTRKSVFKTAHYRFAQKIEHLATKSILMRSAEFSLVQYCFVAI